MPLCSLRGLFIALNDESSAVRALAIRLAGHISGLNPAYVMPALRRHLMQLLSDMDHSPDSSQREGEPGPGPNSALAQGVPRNVWAGGGSARQPVESIEKPAVIKTHV